MILKSLFNIFNEACDYKRLKLVFEFDRNELQNRLTWSSWGSLILNMSQGNIRQLEKIGQRSTTRFYVPNNNPIIINTIIELYLDVLSHFDDEELVKRILHKNCYFSKCGVYEYMFDRIIQDFYHKYNIPFNSNWDLKRMGVSPNEFSEFEDSLNLVISKLKYDENIDRQISPLNPQKWKKIFEEIKLSFEENNDIQLFVERVDKLAYLNELTGNIRLLYVLACRALASSDAFCAIKYYAKACEAYDTTLPPLIGKRIKSLLFPRSSDFERFEMAFHSKDISYYTNPEERTIEIDKVGLAKRLLKYKSTAYQLSEILDDNDGCDELFDFSEFKGSESKNAESRLFELFVANGYMLTYSQISTFANENGLMPNAMIDRINESHYETLDDCIIEEQDGKWILNKDYHAQISKQP